MLVGVFVIITALFFNSILSFIPTSIFIGILIKAGISSMDFQIWQDFRSGQASLFSVIFVFLGSLLVISLDIVLVFLTSIVLWAILKRVPLFRGHCSDIKVCPCVD